MLLTNSGDAIRDLYNPPSPPFTFIALFSIQLVESKPQTKSHKMDTMEAANRAATAANPPSHDEVSEMCLAIRQQNTLPP